ncbi:sensor histidine kinase [Halobacterium jilantaiense]|uniref:histidine kinase n=1 Tax=Halobacterium jilantaiense TaxID=355548 RepID=A0A1I0QFJ7_9EURY|nr:histidine kinase N-terminal 7TM domain-containing protein [Halobacterium jilantaiense]SEW25791.1 PAS fold-containing protein [Halobacterium jilantaiense]
MALQVTPYTPPLAAAGVAFLVTAAWVSRRTDPGMRSTWLAVPLFLATGFWTLTYAAELTVTGYEAQLFFGRLQYAGTATVPVLWLAYVTAYVGYDDIVPRWAWGALAVPPAFFVAFVASYPATTLFWTATTQVTVDGYVLFDTAGGPLFDVFIVYVYALVFVATAMLAERVWFTQGVYRRQAMALLAGSLVPAVAGVVYITGISPIPALNLPALGFVATGTVVAYSVVSSDLFTLEPVAWETAVAELDDPVFVVDSRERIVAANPAGRAFAGADIGTPAADALGHVFEEPYWRQPGDHTVAHDGCDGTRALSVSVTPVDRDGATAGHVLVVRDVTERERREQRLAEFASVASHDLRNPLNVARGHLQLGRESGDEQHFQEVDGALDRMEDIIDDLLTLAREGETAPDAEPVSLAAAAHTAWEFVAASDVDATLDVEEDTTVTANETALIRLLENLFRNAVEHGSNPEVETTGEPPDDGGSGVTVRIGATADGFYVSDDGPGVPDTDRETVFESGYTTSADGTGFGLSIVAEIADNHGWTVDLVDDDAGGARFEFDT